jgi:hypothetical protein
MELFGIVPPVPGSFLPFALEKRFISEAIR